jgi:hypothetical protein
MTPPARFPSLIAVLDEGPRAHRSGRYDQRCPRERERERETERETERERERERERESVGNSTTYLGPTARA